MILSKGKSDQVEENGIKELQDELQSAMESARRELNDIALMLEQSQLEVNKLAQRNATITSNLQKTQANLESTPRTEIRSAYDAALDGQQRLFVMRGQLEKLQSDRAHLERMVNMVDRVLRALDVSTAQQGRAKSSHDMIETVEMMVKAQEAERQRLARQMHDEPAQALSNFILQTEIAMRLFDIDQAKAKEELASLKTAATSTFQKVRDFIFELRPMMLDDLGLAPTLQRYAEAYKEQSGVDIKMALTGMEQRLESYLEVMLFRAVQELVGNAVRHSQCSMIKVQLDVSDTFAKVTVEDNGRGFDVEEILNRGMGVKVIRDRVEMLGGMMEIDSVMGQGTHISFQIPAVKARVFAEM